VAISRSAGQPKVYSSLLDVPLVPLGVVTVMSTVPALSAGAVATILVPAPLTVNFVAATDPKCTALAPDSSVPKTSTFVPPATGPLSGETEVTVGPS
jgi:hypothetical protein